MATHTESMATALQYYQAGDLRQAEQVCRKVLDQAPHQADALHLLGVISHSSGNLRVAVDCLNQAIARNPSDPSIYSNFGAILQAAGKPAQAIDCLRKALELKPDLAEAHYNLGLALFSHGSCEQAIQSYQKAIELRPDYPDSYNNLGLAFKKQRQFDRALQCFAKAIQFRPQCAEAHHNAGLVHMDQGKIDKAIEHFKAALRIKQTLPQVQCDLGRAFQALGRVEESIVCFRSALELQPQSANANKHLGFSFYLLGRLPEAINHYLQAASLDPGDVTAYCNLATALRHQGRLDEALSIYRKALDLKPDYADAIAGEASIYERKGDIERAGNALRPFIEDGTDSPQVALAYATICRRMNRQHEAVPLVEEILAMDNLPDFERQSLHFALGDLHDDSRRYAEAFFHYQQGNPLSPQKFDPQAHSLSIQQLMEAFSKKSVAKYPWNTKISDRPIFIIGMPRSGRSLVEQILASHPRVHAAGQLGYIDEIVSSLPKTLGSSKPYPLCMGDLSEGALENLAEECLEQLNQHAGVAERITDSTPENFLHLGLISLLFPHATIIHCVRDPLDTCLSCYFQNFVSRCEYSFDLHNLGVYYGEYQKLMSHWHNVLEVQVLEVSYEQLVAKTEEISRRMVRFCDLNWDDQCLRFHETEPPLKTGSYDQVQRPIYSNSVGRHKHYEQYLGLLRESLGEQAARVSVGARKGFFDSVSKLFGWPRLNG